jgi:hypothetical protein
VREPDADDRIEASVRDRDRQAGAALEVELEALDARDEAAEREDRSRAWALRGETERIRHHRALREAAENEPVRRERVLLEHPVHPVRQRRKRLQERLAVRRADLSQDVPVASSRRQAQRSARQQADEVSVGIKSLEKRR